MSDGVVLAHDYATQRGGAERVALLMLRAFPGSPLYTTLFDPGGTFPEFARADVRTSSLDRAGLLRRHHRLALPLLSTAVDRQRVEGDVLLASSTGWAHGYRGARRTVVYCHAPARWLYQRDRYLGVGGSLVERSRATLARATLRVLDGPLRDWDRRAAERADTYLVNSSVTRDAVRAAYGIEAEVLPPPPALAPGPVREVRDGGEPLAPGYLLCVARLLPYKNVDVVVEAALALGRRLVVVGEGPDRARLEQLAARGEAGAVRLVGRVDDAELRWLYQHASALVAASHEDYGLTPLEAGMFDVPVAALRGGGYLDTVRPGVNGEFFDEVAPDAVALAVERLEATRWDLKALRSHLADFGERRFTDRLRTVVSGLLGEYQQPVRSSNEGAAA
ncbi:glycosyltransferase family 4 protein [Isoptericola halotolerans]|uniref:D-inositol 3-phosphate glycosyltransferase n=1 Tax=Isoptericola halotolerans TaxID=300560 RepID=A0ABX2A759_9MICO|nr:glycosyltransferase [Isoptericola halotolerans]NOV97423.1 glycosyltransferase involved in cell wall biosynthesis [Isoptericola halotolerans]